MVKPSGVHAGTIPGAHVSQMNVAKHDCLNALSAKLVHRLQKLLLEGLRRSRGKSRGNAQRLRLCLHRLDWHAMEAHAPASGIIEGYKPSDLIALTNRTVERKHRILASAEGDGTWDGYHP